MFQVKNIQQGAVYYNLVLQLKLKWWTVQVFKTLIFYVSQSNTS